MNINEDKRLLTINNEELCKIRMAYIKLSSQYNAALRRIAWGLGKPMTRTLVSLIDDIIVRADSKVICSRCKDSSYCGECLIYSKNPSYEEKTVYNLIQLVPDKHRNKVTILEAVKTSYSINGYDITALVIEETNKSSKKNYRELLIESLKKAQTKAMDIPDIKRKEVNKDRLSGDLQPLSV